MSLTEIKCKNCGSTLSIEEGQNKCVCPSCSTEYYLQEDVINNYSTKNITVNHANLTVFGKKDFEIVAGKLIKYNGESENVIIPDNVTIIGQNCFSNLGGLKAVKMNDNVVEIESGAFKNCYGLQEVTLSKTLKATGSYAFSNCTSLKVISLPSNIKYISSSTFYNCSKLTSVKFPEMLEEIGTEAFYGCSSLKNVVFPPSLKYIYAKAFADCTSINCITIPTSCWGIEQDAFFGCNHGEKMPIYVDSTLVKRDELCDRCNLKTNIFGSYCKHKVKKLTNNLF